MNFIDINNNYVAYKTIWIYERSLYQSCMDSRKGWARVGDRPPPPRKIKKSFEKKKFYLK